ncbi:MAG: BatD family protein, partial [Hyphomicrobiaceae bacterium]|nr:BatD family protein [Hyphomicrobiaceae bacterium]
MLAIIVLLFAVAAAAAQTATPQPIVRTTLTPAHVVVGQPATLVVEVLAPNFMTKPPVMPDFQIRNAITRTGSTRNMTDRKGDVTYAGIHYEFLIYPQEAGSYALSGQTVTITFSDDPPHTLQTEIPMPAVNFQAQIPDAAASLNPFVSATGLTLEQKIHPSSDTLKAGDAITRTVTVKAEGAPAMLLPPTTFAPVAGTKIYPNEPRLNDQFDQSSGVLTSTRTDSATYMLEAAGVVKLPSLEFDWWNVKDKKIERARVDPQSFNVAGGPATVQGTPQAGGLSAPRKIALFVLEHWFALLSTIAALAALIWALPPVLRNLNDQFRHRLQVYRQSEAHAFEDLRRIAKQGDERSTYRALLVWVSRFEPAAPSGTIKALKAWAGDPVLSREIASLEQRVFAAQSAPASWSSGPLITAIESARSKARHHHPDLAKPHSLPGDINPQSIVQLRRSL